MTGRCGVLLKKIKEHSVFNNALALFSLQFVSMIAPLIVLPYLSRILGLEGFGLVMLALSASAIGLIITDYGFNLSATYTISKNRDDIEFVSELVGAIFIIKAFLLIAFFLALIVFLHFSEFKKDKEMLIIYVGVNIIVQAFSPTWFFQGIEKMKNVTVYMIFAKILYVFLIFTFIKNIYDVNLVILLLAISNSISILIAFMFIYKNGYSIKYPKSVSVLQVFRESSQFFLSRAAIAVYTSASTFIVGAFSGLHQAAMYGACEKLYFASQSVTATIAQSLFPHMAKNDDSKLLFNIIVFVGIPLSIGCAVVGIWAADILALLFGKDFYQAGGIMKLFMFVTIINFISANFGYPAFAGINKIHIANYTVILGGIVQLVCLSVLYMVDGISAFNVVSSVFITEMIVMSLRICLYQYCKTKVITR